MPKDAGHSRKLGEGILSLSLALIAEILAFIIDFLVPPGYADWLLYILPLLIVLGANRRPYLYAIATVASILLISRTFIYPLEPGKLPMMFREGSPD
jgi:hypothetical protein